uniref:Photosystem I subunit X n=1 Tax=Glycine max TaxID=3847 RepID=C6T358_SOYBN|nr:unknown [Glycine max]
MATTVMTTLPQFSGLRPQFSAAPVKNLVAVQPMSRKGKGALGARCDYIGSSTNLIMVASTTLMLFAGRFGLAPSANRKATAGLKLEVRDSGLQTGDPAGFTLADTLACGSVGHIIGVWGCSWSQEHWCPVKSNYISLVLDASVINVIMYFIFTSLCSLSQT